MSSTITSTKQQEQRKIRNDKYYKNNGLLLHKIRYLQSVYTFPQEINNLATITPADKREKYKQILHHITILKLTAVGIS